MCSWHGKNHYPVSNQLSKQNNWNKDLFKVNSQCIGIIMQTKQHKWCMLMTLNRSLCNRNMQWLVNTSLLKVICRSICLCKLAYPVIYRLTLNKSDLHQTSKILNIILKQLPSISAIRTTIYEMTWSLSSVLTWHRPVQLKLNSDVNWTIKLNKKQIKASVKQNGIRWCQQCKKPCIRQNRAWLAQRLWTENKLCKEHK